ncbi:MAG: TlpA disulfide reductase family protein [Candidatus Kapabacteria bacterium]|nr:TlpA disulfide reductase family protein [Candidatus Kapabacteria bacterium]
MFRNILITALFIGVFSTFTACSEGQAGTNSNSKTPVYQISTVMPAKAGFSVDFKYNQDGKDRSFAELTKGKVVLLNFWGTWCGPCRRELPDLIEISKDLKNKDFIMIGIAMEQVAPTDAAKKVAEFGGDKGIEYINFIANNAIREAYGKIPSVPTTFIIDKNGKIIEKIVGSRDKATFMTSINRLLN